jgi:hypothetical protein
MTSFGGCRGSGTPAINDKTDLTTGQYLFYQDWTFTQRFSKRQTRPTAPVAGSTNMRGREVAERLIMANYYPCIGGGGYYYYEHRITSQTPIDDPEPHQDIAHDVLFEAVNATDSTAVTEIFHVTPESGCSFIDNGYGGSATISEDDLALASAAPTYGDGNALTDGFVLVGQPAITQAGIRANGPDIETYGPVVTVTPNERTDYRVSYSSGIVFIPYQSVTFRFTTTIQSWAHVEAGGAIVRLAACLPL